MEAISLRDMNTSTRARKIKVGDIITFKKPFLFKGDEYLQIGILDIEITKEKIRLIGFGRMTGWYGSYEDLGEAIDWDWMDKWIINY
jgi:hypothetical protein